MKTSLKMLIAPATSLFHLALLSSETLYFHRDIRESGKYAKDELGAIEAHLKTYMEPIQDQEIPLEPIYPYLHHYCSVAYHHLDNYLSYIYSISKELQEKLTLDEFIYYVRYGANLHKEFNIDMDKKYRIITNNSPKAIANRQEYDPDAFLDALCIEDFVVVADAILKADGDEALLEHMVRDVLRPLDLSARRVKILLGDKQGLSLKK